MHRKYMYSYTEYYIFKTNFHRFRVDLENIHTISFRYFCLRKRQQNSQLDWENATTSFLDVICANRNV